MPERLHIQPAVLRRAGDGIDDTARRFAQAVDGLRAALSDVGDCWGGDEPGASTIGGGR